MDERQLAAAIGAEIPAETEMHPGKEAVENIPAQIPRARRNDGGVGGEQPHDIRRDELHQHGRHRTKAQRNADAVPQRSRCTVVAACADFLCAQRRHGGEHRRRHQEHKADELFHHAHSSCVCQAAPVGNDGNDQKRNLDQAILHGHRYADAQDAPDDGTPGAEVAFLQLHAVQPAL